LKIIREKICGLELTFCGIIKGLVSEKRDMDEFLKNSNPRVIAIGLSPEEVRGMRNYIENPENVPLSEYDVIYGTKLSEFGEVAVPPPAYISVFLYEKENDGVEIYPLDMPDEIYADVFTKCVSSYDLIMHSLRKKRLTKKKFRSTSAEEFVMEWDKEIRKLKGYDRLEREREKYMAKKLLEILKKDVHPVVIVELERLPGILENLKSLATI